jgi:hypothetical protein
MKTQQKTEETKAPVQSPATPETPAASDKRTVNDLFHRAPVGHGPVRTLTMRRTLTRPMVSMAKRKMLVLECQSEVKVMELPSKTRKGGVSKAIVLEGIELVPVEGGVAPSDEIIVALHSMMASAIGKAGFATLIKSENDDQEEIIEVVPGKPLTGVTLGFAAGDIEDGKRYRSISVVELE